MKFRIEKYRHRDNDIKMKNYFIAFLISVLLMPMMTAWMPHAYAHSLQAHSQEHHVAVDQDGHIPHGLTENNTNNVHHLIDLDITDFYSDFLHVDLQRPDMQDLNVSQPDSETAEFIYITDLRQFGDGSVRHGGIVDPPDYRTGQAPVYLLTQRIRI